MGLTKRETGNICPHCGAKKVEYKFGFNKGLAVFLGKLYREKNPVRSDDLHLTYSQRTNSQKLQYWGLAVPYISPDTKRKRGWWKITEKGRQFVRGEVSIPKYAITVRGKLVRHEGSEIFFSQVSDGYLYHGDYAEQVSLQL